MIIRISLSAALDHHDGQRIDRIPDYEDAGFKEGRAAFKRRAKRKVKLKKNIAIPYRVSAPADISSITVTKANWLGRLERHVPPRPRRTLPSPKN